MRHISASVRRLSAAILALDSATHYQARQTLQVLADEEAAKILLLLDMVRCPPSMSVERIRLLDCYYDHVAKGIYAQVYEQKGTW